MKKNILLLILMVSITCITNAQWSAEAIPEQSALKWTGSKLFKYNKQFGTIAFLNGEMISSNKVIIGGDYKINLKSIIKTEDKFNKTLAIYLKTDPAIKTEIGITPKLEFIEMTATSINTITVKALITIAGVTSKIDFILHQDSQDGNQCFTSKFSISNSLFKSAVNSKNSSDNEKKDCAIQLIHFKIRVEGMTEDHC